MYIMATLNQIHLTTSNLSILWEAGAINSFTLQKQKTELRNDVTAFTPIHQFLLPWSTRSWGRWIAHILLHALTLLGRFRCIQFSSSLPNQLQLATGRLNRLGNSLALKKMNRSRCTTALRSLFVGSSQLGLMINSSPTDSFISQVQWNAQSLNVDMV